MSTFKHISLGNDVVDLFDPDTIDLLNNRRFLKRVFDPSELAAMPADALLANTYLWGLWAAKEASYKAVRRILPDTVFSPIQFVLGEFDKNSNKGSVIYGDYQIRIHIIKTKDFIHSTGFINIDPSITFGSLATFGQIPAEVQGDEIQESYSNQSSLCRTWAVKKLRDLGWGTDLKISKESSGVPVVYSGREKLPCILSLSHHGRYCGILVNTPQ